MLPQKKYHTPGEYTTACNTCRITCHANCTVPEGEKQRCWAMNEKNGRVKRIANKETDEVIGVHILGVSASELLAEAVLAMEFKASSEDIARTIHGHPTLNEAFHEAALAVDKRAIHKVN